MVFRTPVIGKNGMVVTAHPLSTASALNILRKGGNAVDAALAASSVLSVVLPSQNGIGGDFFALYYNGKEVKALNASGYAGSDLKNLMDLKKMPLVGPLTITVPGITYGWYSLSKYATFELKNIFSDAIKYANDGFPLSLHLVEQINSNSEKISENKFLKNKFKDPYLGKIIKNKELAKTIETIAEDPLSLYKGYLSDIIGRFLEDIKSTVTVEDLNNYEAFFDEPLWTEYRDYRIYETPPNSQGATALLMLKELKDYDFTKMKESEIIEKIVKAKIESFSIRDKYITDRKFLSDEFFNILKNFKGGDGDTVYFNVVDGEGNALSCIQSIYHSFGSGIADPQTGIIFQNRGSYFSLDKNNVNRIESRKRTLHTLMAGMAFSEDDMIVFGAAGAEGQPQTHVQLLINIIDRKMNVQESVEYPRFIHGRYISDDDNSIKLERRFSEKTIEELLSKGYKIKIVDGLDDAMGDANVILKRNSLMGGADPRRDSTGLGY